MNKILARIIPVWSCECVQLCELLACDSDKCFRITIVIRQKMLHLYTMALLIHLRIDNSFFLSKIKFNLWIKSLYQKVKYCTGGLCRGPITKFVRTLKGTVEAEGRFTKMKSSSSPSPKCWGISHKRCCLKVCNYTRLQRFGCNLYYPPYCLL